jgi:ABC-type polysaccharide/polyol phosphate transport system ATPase subunit
VSDFSVKLKDVSKFYKLYESPKDRLKEALHPFNKKYYKEFYALNGINLDVNKGETLGIIGKNGSGKSTLLKLISHVLVPSSGTVEVQGNVSALLELGAGFNPLFTGLENVYFYGTILGFSREDMDARLDKILAFADIGEFIHQPLKTYSSGMKARIAFAIATEINPDILIIDEVLAVGDTIFQRKCYSKIDSMFKDGKTVILVSHNRNSIISLCKSAILLDHGKVLCSGETEPVIREYEKLCNKKFLTANDKYKNTQKDETIDNETKDQKNEQAENKLLWDYTLEADDQVYYKKSDIELEDFGIYDLDGNKVNILETGSSYKIRATFLPKEDLDYDITFAMRIKSIEGYIATWVGFPFEKNKYLSFKEGQREKVEFLFDCNLLGGVFSIDAGLQSFTDDDLFFHVGIQNLYLFKINKDLQMNKHGLVDLNCRLLE